MRSSLAVLTALMIATPATSGPAAAQTEPSPAARAFDRLESLAGHWTYRDSLDYNTGAPRPEVVVGIVAYELVANATTIQETVNGPGHDVADMISMIRVDGDRLVLDHYCSSGTQPRLVSRGLEGDVIRFAFESGTSIPTSTTGHIHEATFTFLPGGGFESRWTWREPGKTHIGVRRHAIGTTPSTR
jgi:hypothetical protein